MSKEQVYKVVVNQCGDTCWYNEQDQYHRENGPAVEYANGDKFWYLNDKLHREDGPAVEYASGYKSWWLNGKLHREYGPAIEYADGDKSWWINGKLHREGGPAIEWANGNKAWYLNGVKYSEEDYNKKLSKRSSSCSGKIVEIEGKSTGLRQSNTCTYISPECMTLGAFLFAANVWKCMYMRQTALSTI